MKAAAIVVAVFVLGGVTGAGVMYATRTPAPTAAGDRGGAPLSPDERADLLTKRLGLTPPQRARVVEVLRHHVANMRAARAELQAAVRAVLEPDQQARFDALIRLGPP